MSASTVHRAACLAEGTGFPEGTEYDFGVGES